MAKHTNSSVNSTKTDAMRQQREAQSKDTFLKGTDHIGETKGEPDSETVIAPKVLSLEEQFAEIDRHHDEQRNQARAKLAGQHIRDAENAFTKAVEESTDEKVKEAYRKLQTLRKHQPMNIGSHASTGNTQGTGSSGNTGSGEGSTGKRRGKAPGTPNKTAEVVEAEKKHDRDLADQALKFLKKHKPKVYAKSEIEENIGVKFQFKRAGANLKNILGELVKTEGERAGMKYGAAE